MRMITFPMVLVAAGCAASQSGERQVEHERVRLSGSEGDIIDVTIQRRDYTLDTTLEAPRETVWATLPAVYEEIGLPVPAADRSIWTVAVQNHVTMRRVGRERMSTLIECGSGITGAFADTHRIRLSVRTWLETEGTGTRVTSRVEATATSTEGRAGTIACESRGVLESRIAELLQQRSST